MREKDAQTITKVMIPIRISNELYKKVRNKVNNKKNNQRRYSINKYITELLEENLYKQQ